MKFKLFARNVVVSVTASVPAEKFTLFSAAVPVETVRVPVEPEYVKLMVDVPALHVRPVVVAICHRFAELFPVIVNVPLPRLIARVEVPEPLNVKSVGLLLFTEKSIVPVYVPHERVRILKLVFTVTVPPPEDPSNVTLSATPGTVWPPAPPDVADQCVVSDASHVPVPPTQKRAAMTTDRRP